MSVTTPSTGQKISDFSAGNVDADSYFIQANSGSTSKVSASQIGQFSNLNLLFSELDTDSKTIVGAINEVNGKEAEDIPYDNTSSGLTATDVQAAIDELDEKTGSDIPVSSSATETIAEALSKFGSDNIKTQTFTGLTVPANNIDTRDLTLTVPADYGILCGFALTGTSNCSVIQCYFNGRTTLHTRVLNLANQQDSYSFVIFYI